MPLENAVLFGIPIPSANPLFLAGVSIHVLFGLKAIVTGACAMLLRKGRGRHSNFGIAYFWCLFGVFVTMSALAFSRSEERRVGRESRSGWVWTHVKCED